MYTSILSLTSILLLFYYHFKVRGAANDADVVILLTDVYGEKLADESLLEK